MRFICVFATWSTQDWTATEAAEARNYPSSTAGWREKWKHEFLPVIPYSISNLTSSHVWRSVVSRIRKFKDSFVDWFPVNLFYFADFAHRFDRRDIDELRIRLSPVFFEFSSLIHALSFSAKSGAFFPASRNTAQFCRSWPRTCETKCR